MMTVSSHLVISADGNDSILVSGKTHGHINTPPIMMPSLQILRDTALDPGLRDKVVLITGASRGLGQTTARLFAMHGSKVAVNYLSSSADAEKVVGEIRAGGGCVLAVKADVTHRSQVQRMVRATIEEWGRIHTKHVPKGVVNTLKAETPQNRLAELADVAKATVFLAYSQASFTTGQNLMVTGGGPPLF